MVQQWKPVDGAAKNDAGEYQALVGGKWQPVAGAAKNDAGQYMALMDDAPQPGIIDRATAAVKSGLSAASSAFSSPTSVMDGYADDRQSKPAPVPDLAPLSQAGYDKAVSMARAGYVPVQDGSLISRAVTSASGDTRAMADRQAVDDAADQIKAEQQAQAAQDKAFRTEHPIMSGFASGAAQLAGSVADAPQLANDTIKEVAINPFMRLFGQYPMKPTERFAIAKDLENTSNALRPDIANKKLSELKGAGDYTDWIAAQAAIQSPQIVGSTGAAFIPKLRAAYLGMMGVTSGALQYQQDLEKNVTQRRAWLDGVTNGAFEVLGEALPFEAFDKIGAIVKSLPSSQRAPFIAEAVKKTLAATGAVLGQHAAEGGSEAFTQVGQNVSQRYIAGDKTQEVMDHVPEAAAIGAIMATPMALSHGYHAARQPQSPGAALGNSLQSEVDGNQFDQRAITEDALRALSPTGKLPTPLTAKAAEASARQKSIVTGEPHQVIEHPAETGKFTAVPAAVAQEVEQKSAAIQPEITAEDAAMLQQAENFGQDGPANHFANGVTPEALDSFFAASRAKATAKAAQPSTIPATPSPVSSEIGEAASARTMPVTQKSIADVVGKAVEPGRSGNELFSVYRPVDDAEAGILKEKTGIDLLGFGHHIDESTVRHILKEHGNTDIERARGQEPVTHEDILRVPEITNPAIADSVEKGVNVNGLETIVYRKRYNGHTIAVEEVRSGRNRLALKTMWKTRAAPSATPKEGVSQTSEPFGTQPPTLGSTISNSVVSGNTQIMPNIPDIIPANPVDVAAHDAATSPLNGMPEPTDAMKHAGNYKKGHVTIHGLDVAIENPKGSERSGIEKDGSPWSITMPDHYGYINRTEGADGDHVDTFVGSNPESDKAFVVDQVNADTGKFEQHKVMLGFDNADEAMNSYRAAFNDGRGHDRIGAVTAMNIGQLKSWLNEGDTKKALAPQITKPAAQTESAPVASPENGTSQNATHNQQNVQDASSAIRPYVEQIIKRRAVGREIKRGDYYGLALQEAKNAMAGKKVSAEKMRKHAIAFASDVKLADAFNGIADVLEASGQAKQPAQKKPQRASTDLLQRIKQLGGIDGAQALDITGEQRAPGGWKFAFNKNGRGLDDLATSLADEGFAINTNDVDGGVQQLRDMIRSHINGERNFKHADIEAQAEQQARGADYDAMMRHAEELGINVKGMTEAQIHDAIYVEEDARIMAELDAADNPEEAAELSDAVFDGIADDGDIKFTASTPDEVAAWIGGYDGQKGNAGAVQGAVTERQEAGVESNSGTNHQEAGAGQEVLQSYTAAEVTQREASQAAHERAQRAEEGAVKAEQAAKDQAAVDAKIKARTDNPDNFQFGENSKQSAAPVADLFNQPAKPVAESKPNDAETGKIDDLGEKIGGARKDTAASRSGRITKESTESSENEPSWRKRFTATQLTEQVDQPWYIVDNRTKRFVRASGYRDTQYSSKDAAEAAIPLIAVAQKHHVVMTSRGDETPVYEIKRYVTDRKRITVVPEKFAGRDDAMRYMAEHAAEILETKTSFGEEILPKPETVQRIGAVRREGDVGGKDFMDTFGFRGVEFGNWNNQEERQDVLNHAYDGLLDLAEVLNIPPKAISLNGDLALAFGARGQGLSGSRAHYEPDYGTINLTKMKGAGALAHEWLHSLDHYLGRLDTPARSEKVANERGDMVYTEASPGKFASHGFSYNSKLRTELREAYKELIETMFYKAEKYVEDTKKAEEWLGRSRDALQSKLDAIRKNLEEQRNPEYYKRNNKPASAEQLAKFDELAEKLIEGQDLGVRAYFDETKRVAGRMNTSMRMSNETLEAMNAIIKDVRGRSGFNAAREGWLDSIRSPMRNYQDRIRMLEEARTATEKTKRVPTDYRRDATEIDQGRASDYWATEHEMAARAFSSYVEDKLDEKGSRSDFLSYGSKGQIPTAFGWVRPFPAGDERVAINKAFDKFFETIQTKETDSGVAMFSRGVSGTDQTVASVTKATTQLRARWLGFRRVSIVQSVKEVPNEIYLRALRALKPIDQGTEGFYDPKTNTVYLIADNIASPERAAWVSVHEVVGHGGLRMLDAKVAEHIDTLAKNTTVAKLARAIAIDRGETFDKATHTEEAIAELAAAYFTNGEKALIDRYGVKATGIAQDGLRGMVQRMIDTIRRVLAVVMGKKVDEVSDAEVRSVINAARRAVEGTEQTDGYGEPSYALASRGKQSAKSFARMALEEFVAENDPVFIHEVSSSKSLDGVLADVAGAEYHGEHTRADERDETGADHRYVFTTPQKHTFHVYETDSGKVWIDVSKLESGSGGQAIYAAVANYAYNANKRFIGDPVGLSKSAVTRRTSNMLSSALRFGTTRHLEAAKEQIKGDVDNGIEPLDWRGSDIDKVEALIHTFVGTMQNLYPSLKEYSYDFQHQQFTRRGQPVISVQPDQVGAVRGDDRRGMDSAQGLGEKTARRAVLLQSLISEGSNGIGERSAILEHILRWGDTSTPGNLHAIFSQRTQEDVLHGDRAGDAGTSGASLASSEAQQSAARTIGFPQSAAVIADLTKDGVMKMHAQYKAAKSGDIAAAVKLVSYLMKPSSIEAAREKFGADVAYVPVMAQEASGKNQIPNALASHYAAMAGGMVATEIHQTNKAYHTGADPMERLVARSEFGGKVMSGQKYVLVDDVSTMGGTLADMASYIQSQGGVVSGAVLLTNASRSGSMAPDAKTIRSLEVRHGQAIRELFGIEPSALTRDEAQYLIGFRTTDELRNRAASAIAERGRRVLSKNLSESANPPALSQSDAPLSSRAPSGTAPLNLNTTAAQPANSSIPEEKGLKGWFQEKQRQVQDKMNRFKVLQAWINHKGVKLTDKANVHEVENLMHAKIANQTEDFRNQVEAPLLERAAKAGFTLEQIADYLEAQHIPEANARMRDIHQDTNATANGITDADAQTTLAQFQSMPKFTEFKALADEFRAIGDETLDMRLREGLISQEQYDAYKATYQHWVPLRGDGKKPGVGKGLSVNAKEKRRLGHGERENGEYIIENLLMDRERAIYQIEHNRVVKSIIQFALEAKEPDMITVGKPEKRQVLKDQSVFEVQHKGKMMRAFSSENDAKAFINQAIALSSQNKGGGMARSDFAIGKTSDPIVVMQASPMLAENEIQGYVAGHTIRIQLNDELLARAATNMGVDQLNMYLSAARWINNGLSKMYTAYSPDFIFRNAIRDFIAGTINLTGDMGAAMAGKIYMNYGKAAKELFVARNDPRKSAWVQKYRAAGGNTGAAYLSDIERVGNDAVAAMHEHMKTRDVYRTMHDKLIAEGRSEKYAHLSAAWRSGVSALGAIPVAGHFLTLIEHLNAVTENALRLATYMTLVQNGYTEQKAASAAKNSTVNFNRKGEISNMMGSLYLFFNPSVQGSSRMFGSLLTSEHKGQAQALAGMLAFTAFALAELGRGGDEDDERKWKNIPDYVKDHNLILKHGDLQWTIPVPYEFAPFHVLGNSISDAVHGEGKWKAAIKVLKSIVDNTTPLGDPFTGDGKDGLNFFQMLPTLAKMALAPHENENSFGAPIQPEKASYNKNKPDSQNMFRNTKGTIYSGAAEWVNEITGGSKYRSGGVDVSPETLKFWVSSLTGGAGRFVADSISAVYGATKGVAPDLRSIPIARVFVREPSVADVRSRFWEAANEAKAAADALAMAKKAHDGSAMKEIRDADNDLIQLSRFADRMGKAAAKKRDLIDQIRMDDQMPLAQKREQMKAIEQKEQEYYDRFLKMFDQKQKVKLGKAA